MQTWWCLKKRTNDETHGKNGIKADLMHALCYHSRLETDLKQSAMSSRYIQCLLCKACYSSARGRLIIFVFIIFYFMLVDTSYKGPHNLIGYECEAFTTMRSSTPKFFIIIIPPRFSLSNSFHIFQRRNVIQMPIYSAQLGMDCLYFSYS